MENKPKYFDGVDWIVERYFSVVSTTPFSYKGRTFNPRTLYISPSIARSVECPEMCGACCLAGNLKSSLDYLPKEKPKKNTKLLHVHERQILITHQEDVSITLFSDFQVNNSDECCSGLRVSDGRCEFYPNRPFNCDFALIMTNIPKSPPARMSTRHFGRSWAMKRVDGNRGALCRFHGPAMEHRSEVIRKLTRLQEWCNHFGFQTTKVPAIIKWLNDWVQVPETGLLIPATGERKRGFLR